MKDHLGSIRAVINEDNEVVNAQDYDMWGYLLENRTFNIDEEKEKYKFTGKERDEESSYDYFGARYYMSRIGRWGSVDPLFAKHYDFSSYNYVLDNPLIFVDPNGKQLYIIGEDSESLLDLLNIDNLSIDPDNKNRVKFSGKNTEGFTPAELKIVNLIQGKLKHKDDSGNEFTVEVQALLLENPYFFREDDIYLYSGEGFLGVSKDYENMKIIATQIFNIEVINALDEKGVYDDDQLTLHGILEATIAGELDKGWSVAHLGAIGLSELYEYKHYIYPVNEPQIVKDKKGREYYLLTIKNRYKKGYTEIYKTEIKRENK